MKNSLIHSEVKLDYYNERLARASLKERAVILEKLYLEMMKNEEVDSDRLIDVVSLIEKWGHTTKQRFDNHLGKLMMKLLEPKIDMIAEAAKAFNQRLEDTIIELKSVNLDQRDIQA